MLSTILLVFALVLLIIEAFRPAQAWGWPIPHLGWLGLGLWVLSIVLSGMK